jgi:hypothetical protein
LRAALLLLAFSFKFGQLSGGTITTARAPVKSS